MTPLGECLVSIAASRRPKHSTMLRPLVAIKKEALAVGNYDLREGSFR